MHKITPNILAACAEIASSWLFRSIVSDLHPIFAKDRLGLSLRVNVLDDLV